MSDTPRAIDELVAAALAWRDACETDDDTETEKLIDAVDTYRHAVEEAGVRG